MQQGQWSYVPLLNLMTQSTRYICRNAMSANAGAGGLRTVGMAQMAALALGRNAPQSTPPRGRLLRLLDTLAEWQMRHSHDVISRVQPDAAIINNVTQPSSANERSSTSPCDR